MKKTLLASVCAASVALAVSADAGNAADLGAAAVSPQPSPPISSGPNWYVSIFGGVALMDDYEPLFAQPAISFFSRYTTEFDTGYIVGGAIGTEFYPNVRGELEISYQRVEPDSHASATLTGVSPSGHLSSVSVLANVWYDIDMGSGFSPYVGAGAGLGIVDSNLTITNGFGQQWDDRDVGFAFQVGGGVKYDVSPRIDIDVGYRFRGILGIHFDDNNPGFAGAGALWQGDDDIYSHIIQAGITFKLGTP